MEKSTYESDLQTRNGTCVHHQRLDCAATLTSIRGACLLTLLWTAGRGDDLREDASDFSQKHERAVRICHRSQVTRFQESDFQVLCHVLMCRKESEAASYCQSHKEFEGAHRCPQARDKLS